MAILIDMDMPKDCFACRLMLGGWCHAAGFKPVRITDCSRKPDWCPLKEAVPVSVANHYDDGKHTRYVFYRTEEQL